MKTFSGSGNYLNTRNAKDNQFVNRFSRWFLIASVLLIGGSALTLGLVYRYVVINNLQSFTHNNNVIVGKLLTSHLYQQHRQFLITLDQTSSEELHLISESNHLDKHVQNMIPDINILKVRIFNLEGRINYSTFGDEIGQSVAKEEFLQTILTGEPITNLIRHKFRGQLSDSNSKQDFAQTYLPLINPDKSDEILGVFEIYQDVSSQMSSLRSSSVLFVAVLFGIMCVLFFVSRKFLNSAEKTMRRQLVRNEKLLSAIDAMPQGILLADGELNKNHISFVNKAAEKLLAGGQHSLLGTQFDQLIPEDSHVFTADEHDERPLVFSWKETNNDYSGSEWTELILGSGVSIDSEGHNRSFLIGIVNDITQRKKDEMQNEQLAASIESSGDAIEICDCYGNYEYVNTSFEQMMGCTLNQIVGKTPAEVFQFSEAETDFYDEVWHQVNEKKPWKGTYKSRTTSNEMLDLEVSVFPILDELDQVKNIVSIKRDITENLAEKEKNTKLSVAVEQSSSMVMITSERGIIEYVNPSFLEVTGYRPDQVIGKSPGLFHSGKTSLKTYNKMWEALRTGTKWRGEILNKKADDSEYWELQTISPIRNDANQITHYVAIKEDVSDRKRAESQLEHMAMHDDLTDLLNRTSFQQHLKSHLAHSKRTKEMGALLLVDVDGFKEINETLGHDFGDLVLAEIARRIIELKRDSDVVARLSGDEFAIIATDMVDENSAAQFADRLMQYISAPIHLNDRTLAITISIGIAMIPTDGDHVDELLRHADMALYRSKDRGVGVYYFYRSEMDHEVQQFKLIASALKRAIKAQEFELYYQPVVHQGQASSVEALIRWNDPEKGLVSPAEFIPVAEQTRLIVPMGLWVIEQACMQIQDWLTLGLEIGIAVNLSPVQFHDGDLDIQIENIVSKTGIPSHLLKLEITEGMAIDNGTEVIRVLTRMQSLGMEILLDDFGTGYSSLSQLRNLPIDRLKIDQSFLQDIRPDFVDKSVIRAILQLGQSLNMSVTVEGVETEFQEKTLLELGCTDFQGYLFARPAPANMVTAYLIGNQTLAEELTN